VGAAAVKVFIIAGEPSGDRLGAALMAGLRDLRANVTFDGVGGDTMAALGLQSRFPMSDLSVMGLAEVLPRLRLLRARIRQTIAAIQDTKPDLVITIDSPDFCLRVLRGARAQRSRPADSALCGPQRLGMAAQARGQDGPFGRSCAGAAAV
jgi:lipid-A-disaccharide synthase